MNVRRMEKLAAHLESIPRKSFDMTSWVDGKPLIDVPFFERDDYKILKRAHENEYKCGMTACVGGHACLVFPHLLKLTQGGVYLSKGNAFVSGHYALAQVLEICNAHAYALTSAYAEHTTPKQAARFLRRLIKQNPDCCDPVKRQLAELTEEQQV